MAQVGHFTVRFTRIRLAKLLQFNIALYVVILFQKVDIASCFLASGKSWCEAWSAEFEILRMWLF